MLECTIVQLFSFLTNAHFLTSNEILGSILSSAGRIDATVGAARAFYYNYPDEIKSLTKFLTFIKKHAGLMERHCSRDDGRS